MVSVQRSLLLKAQRTASSFNSWAVHYGAGGGLTNRSSWSARGSHLSKGSRLNCRGYRRSVRLVVFHDGFPKRIGEFVRTDRQD